MVSVYVMTVVAVMVNISRVVTYGSKLTVVMAGSVKGGNIKVHGG